LKKQINGILGGMDVASHTARIWSLQISNQFNASLEYGWNKNLGRSNLWTLSTRLFARFWRFNIENETPKV
jgi:hypothetical protein